MHSFFGTYSTVYAFIFSWVDIDVVSSFFLLFLGTEHPEIKGKDSFIIENLYCRTEKKNKGS